MTSLSTRLHTPDRCAVTADGSCQQCHTSRSATSPPPPRPHPPQLITSSNTMAQMQTVARRLTLLKSSGHAANDCRLPFSKHV